MNTRWYFFKTLKEKQFIGRQIKKGNFLPLLKYITYRFGVSSIFSFHRKWYSMRVWYSPYAFWLWNHIDKEKDEELFLESFLKPGDSFIDCGAHLGTLTITASKIVGELGKVLAFEPHPRTYSFLKKNIEDNHCNNVTTYNMAVGEVQSKAYITDFYANDLNTLDKEGEIEVGVVTLDNLLSGETSIDLLKLDVEGSELQALIGGQNILAKTKAVYFESAEGSFLRFGYSLKEVLKYLDGKGFDCYHVNGKTVGQKVSPLHVTKTRYENILALKR